MNTVAQAPAMTHADKHLIAAFEAEDEPMPCSVKATYVAKQKPGLLFRMHQFMVDLCR